MNFKMIIRSTKLILFLIAIIGFFLGMILGILPGVIALGDGNPIYIQFLVVGVLVYASTTLIVIFIWKQYGKETPSVKTSSAIRVVAIDDEADILRLIRIKLSKEGFDVSTATNGEEGISKVLREKPDVMVVDVMMPGKDGYQVVSEVKAKLGEDAPVTIMLTSKAEDGDMVKGLKVGADDYITKPFSPGELIERINVALIKGVKESK
jgi:CheY-like chemotaxis protein